MDLNKFLRKNIVEMEAYTAARDLVVEGNYIFLDANENPFGNYNRYPDPLQKNPKKLLSEIKGVDIDNMVMGNGSDEILDLIYRVSCNPGIDQALSLAPSYGMYQTLAELNNVKFNTVMLNEEFDCNSADILKAVNEKTKLIIICSPNNPTGNAFDINKIVDICQKFDGLVVVDEAYNDFAGRRSCITELKNYKNLVVIQTFSKAWGMACLRCGIGYMNKELSAMINKVKLPYNMNGVSQKAIVERLGDLKSFQQTVNLIIDERERLIENLKNIDCIEKIFHSDANFILVRAARHQEIRQYLLDNGMIVRSRHGMPLCNNCLRITVGSPEENDKLIELLKKFK